MTTARKTTAKTTAKAPAKTTARKAPARKAPARKAPAKVWSVPAMTHADEQKLHRSRGWNRAALFALFGEAWADMVPNSAEALSPEGRARGLAVGGWVLPAECVTPGREVDQSMVNSVRAYIGKVVLVSLTAVGCPNVPTLDKVATIYDPNVGMVIYRRA